MPYDYYEFLKKLRDSDEYTEVNDVVRQNIFSESINFKLTNEWLKIEDKIRIRLYLYLRYN